MAALDDNYIPVDFFREIASNKNSVTIQRHQSTYKRKEYKSRMSAVGWRTRRLFLNSAWLDYRLYGQTKRKAALSAGCWSISFCSLLIIFPWVWAALEERNDYPEVIALKIAASSILGLRLALGIFRVPSDSCFGKERILTVSKLYIAVIAVTFLAQLPVMVLYMVKTTQNHLEVTIVIGILESLLLWTLQTSPGRDEFSIFI